MKFISLTIFLSISIALCGQTEQKRRKVEIETKYGKMLIELYNETPKHRDNFIKLVSEKYYDNQLFHRVIKNFMIQGGDPNSINAAPGQQLGNGGPDYTIEAEFVPNYIHKKGALAAARQGDNINPEKRSSGSQFYIVQGNIFQQNQLIAMMSRNNQSQLQELTRKYILANSEVESKLKTFQNAEQYDSVNAIVKSIMELMKQSPNYKPLEYTDKQIETYLKIGGTPHLDGGYTVFGEVISGLSVIDSIAAQPTGQADRPVQDQRMKIRIVD